MLTEEEIDALARELLTSAVQEVLSWDANYFDAIHQMDSGELIPVYSATSLEGYGSFLCQYMPLAAIKKIIKDCEQSFDKFEITLTDKETGQEEKRQINQIVKNRRPEAIKFMARWASVHLIAFFKGKLVDSLEEAVADSGIVAVSTLAALMAETLVKTGIPVQADARQEIEKAAKRVADKKRDMLRDHIENLPHLLTKRGRGAPLKSPERRKLEREAYAARVESAYRKLRATKGKKPTKVSVASELGEGGINPQKGSDTRLNAFNLKLARLEIKYEEITKKVEGELHNNS